MTTPLALIPCRAARSGGGSLTTGIARNRPSRCRRNRQISRRDIASKSVRKWFIALQASTERWTANGHRSGILWFTGLSGAGTSR